MVTLGSMDRAVKSILLGAIVGLLVGVACAHDDPCRSGSCGCVGGDACVLACEVSPCEIECGELDRCDASCKDDCHVECRDLTRCTPDCGADCVIECDRLSDCDATCGPRCEYACRDVSACEVAVGPDSMVSCDRVGTCAVECHGACRVACVGVGTCDVRCLDLEGNDLGEAAQEASGERVCT